MCDIVSWVTKRDVTNNGYITFASEVIVNVGIQDHARCLLSFEFQEEFKDVRGDIFARSVSELIIGNEAGEEDFSSKSSSKVL